MIYRIPTNLKNLNDILINKGIEPKFVKNHLHKFYYIIHHLKMQTIYNKKIRINGAYVPLSNDYLHDLMGGAYCDKIISTLIKTGIIEYDEKSKYDIGRCKKYRLNTIHLTNITYFNLSDSKSKFSQKLDKRTLKDLKTLLSIKEFKTQYLNIKTLNFNFNKLNDFFIKNCVLIGLEKIFLFDDTFSKKNVNNVLDELQTEIINNINSDNEDRSNQLISFIYAINRINLFNKKNDDGLHFIVDKKGFRLHNNLTSLSKELKPFLRFEDKNVEDADIKSSQLFMLAINMNKSGSKRKDYNKFAQDCKEIDMYAFLSNKNTRDEQKTDVYTNLLFGRIYENKITNKFKSEYPEVYNHLTLLKSNSYKNSSTELQKTESLLVLKVITNKITKLYPNLLFNTIHDSFLVEEGYGIIIADLIKKTIYDLYSISINLTVKNYEDGTIEKI